MRGYGKRPCPHGIYIQDEDCPACRQRQRDEYEADLLARKDVITEAEWRRQSAEWAGQQ